MGIDVIDLVGNGLEFARSGNSADLTDDEIAERLRENIAWHLGVDIDQVTDDARFVKDLGVS